MSRCAKVFIREGERIEDIFEDMRNITLVRTPDGEYHVEINDPLPATQEAYAESWWQSAEFAGSQ